MVIALAVIAQVGFVNWVLAVELIPLNGTNSTQLKLYQYSMIA